MFDEKTRVGSAQLARRLRQRPRRPRRDLNEAIASSARCCTDLEPVTTNLSDPRRSSAASSRRSPTPPREVAPVAETAGLAVREPRHHVHRARRASRGPSSRRRSRERRRPRTWPSAASRTSGRSSRNRRGLLRASCARAWPRCRTRRRSWPTPSSPAPDASADAADERPPSDAVRHAGATSRPTRSCSGGVDRSRRPSSSLKPTLAFLTPVQTTCNYVTLFFRNASSLLSEGDKTAPGSASSSSTTPQGPTTRVGPSSAPANGPATTTPPREPVPEHGVARPDQGVRGRQRGLLTGRRSSATSPGNQGTKTERPAQRPNGRHAR